MELKKGMYVRTKEGNIEKICDIENEHIYTDEDYLSWYPSSNAISKASEELPELLEKGDFLDNHCIVKIVDRTFFLNDGWFISFDDVEDLVCIIVTKEQFESIGYKVDGE